MDFKVKGSESYRTVLAPKASATVIEPGDVTELAAGLIVKGTATGARLAHCREGAIAGETLAEVSEGNNFVLEGTPDANFVGVTHRGQEVDLVVNAGVQQIDLGASATDVFRVDISETAGTEGTTEVVAVRINLPIF